MKKEPNYGVKCSHPLMVSIVNSLSWIAIRFRVECRNKKKSNARSKTLQTLCMTIFYLKNLFNRKKLYITHREHRLFSFPKTPYMIHDLVHRSSWCKATFPLGEQCLNLLMQIEVNNCKHVMHDFEGTLL